jgi:putative sigma-54 modulation protein
MLKCIKIQLTKNYMHMKNNLIISGLHLDLTDALKNIVNDKMEKIFKHDEKIIRARIELDQDSRSSSHKNQFTAKGHLELKGPTITISSSSDNLYKAIDNLIERLDRGLRRKARLQRVKRKQISLQDLPYAA